MNIILMIIATLIATILDTVVLGALIVMPKKIKISKPIIAVALILINTASYYSKQMVGIDSNAVNCMSVVNFIVFAFITSRFMVKYVTIPDGEYRGQINHDALSYLTLDMLGVAVASLAAVSLIVLSGVACLIGESLTIELICIVAMPMSLFFIAAPLYFVYNC